MQQASEGNPPKRFRLHSGSTVRGESTAGQQLPEGMPEVSKVGLARSVKRKAEEVLKQEITKQAKKELSNSNMKKAVHVANTHFPKQVKKVRDIFGV